MDLNAGTYKEWTYKELPQARMVLQALLLEEIGFQIGDPADPDATKREAALKKLAEAKAAFHKAWDEAQKSK